MKIVAATDDRAFAFDPFAESLGIDFVPVDRGTKRPYHDGWTDPARSFGREDFRPSDSYGGRWGQPSGDIIDIDCDIIEACRIAAHVIKRGPRWGRAGKPSSHYLVRCRGARTKKFLNPIASATNKTIIEIRSTGSQSVLPPSPHVDGGHYEWERQELPVEVDPSRLVAEISEIAAAAFVATLWKDGSRHSLALNLAGFLAKNRIPEDRALRFVEWVTIGAQDRERADRLRVVKDTYDAYAKGEEITANFKDVEHGATVANTLIEWLGIDQQRFRIYDEQALISRPAAPFLVKGAIVQGSLVTMVSPPDLGKTFLTLDLMMSIAAGQEAWLGQRLLKSGPVFYIVGEGAGRFKLRYLAWKQFHRVTDPLPFYWIDQAMPLLDEKAAAAFIKQVAPLRPLAVVFDTLSRCLIGGDENSAADMGRAIAVCDELRARTSATVFLLHHTRKDGTSERGSSALRGAVDTILTLGEDADDRGLITLRCERQKDAEPFAPIEFRRLPFQLDDVLDDDGDPASSCVIQLADPSTDPRQSSEEDRRERLVAFVRSRPGCSKTAAAKSIDGRRASAYKLIDTLRDERVLETRWNPKTKMDELYVAETTAPIPF